MRSVHGLSFLTFSSFLGSGGATLGRGLSDWGICGLFGSSCGLLGPLRLSGLFFCLLFVAFLGCLLGSLLLYYKQMGVLRVCGLGAVLEGVEALAL